MASPAGWLAELLSIVPKLCSLSKPRYSEIRNDTTSQEAAPPGARCDTGQAPGLQHREDLRLLGSALRSLSQQAASAGVGEAELSEFLTCLAADAHVAPTITLRAATYWRITTTADASRPRALCRNCSATRT